MALVTQKTALAAGLPKDFYVVPAGKVFKLRAAACRIQATATVGNRRAVLSFLNPTTNDPLIAIPAGAFQTAGQNISYFYGLGIAHITTISNNSLTLPVPDVWLESGSTLRITDSGGVDLAGDQVETIINGELFEREAYFSRPLGGG